VELKGDCDALAQVLVNLLSTVKSGEREGHRRDAAQLKDTALNFALDRGPACLVALKKDLRPVLAARTIR
jgi:hypothetical protein